MAILPFFGAKRAHAAGRIGMPIYCHSYLGETYIKAPYEEILMGIGCAVFGHGIWTNDCSIFLTQIRVLFETQEGKLLYDIYFKDIISFEYSFALLPFPRKYLQITEKDYQRTKIHFPNHRGTEEQFYAGAFDIIDNYKKAHGLFPL